MLNDLATDTQVYLVAGYTDLRRGVDGLAAMIRAQLQLNRYIGVTYTAQTPVAGYESGCKSLKSITIPSSVTSIGWYAFCHCTSLKSITIPKSVTSIDKSTFSDCPNLTIKCYSGSKAESYAKNNNIKYEIIG